MANIYKMNERISFIKFETCENENGFKETKETVEYTCWANRLNLSNSEFANTYATFNKYIISFRVRCCKFTKNLEFNTKKYKVKYKDNLFNIISAIDYKNLHKYIDVKIEVNI